MSTLRANASLTMLAKHARKRADTLKRAWLVWCVRGRTEILTWDEQCRRESAWHHFSDVDALATHLERLAGRKGEP